ncbi:MAG: terpene cyclase/mutase family protein [Planctomycetes bacterium]|nr:terpene cyclase/mutase family protein [Planctomycetota bacterium]
MRPLASFLLIVLVSACSAQAGTGDDGRAAAAKAAKFLWSKQGPDGGWHSETYGLLRSGQSLTPFILLALLDAPDAPREAVDRAIAFIRANTNGDGEVGRSDPSLEDYPNFATALAVGAFVKAGRKDVDKMISALRRQQFTEKTGWGPEHPAHGAWGMGGPLRTPPHTGHVDLSMTRHVLQAVPDERALKYLERCRNADGGYMFSPVVLDANKAGVGKSYGTATADAVLALLALKKSADAPLGWLIAHHRVDGVPGFDESTAKWKEGMLHYYLAASAQAFQQAGRGPAEWQQEMIRSLAARQREDGSFKNASFLMKEDDPLIATTFALLALISARS